MNWISVTDRLPKYNTDVLVISKNMCRIAKFLPESAMSSKQDSFVDHRPGSNWMEILVGVTHWMPLPDMPEGML